MDALIKLIENLADRGVDVFDKDLIDIIPGEQILNLIEEGKICMSPEYLQKAADVFGVPVEALADPNLRPEEFEGDSNRRKP